MRLLYDHVPEPSDAALVDAIERAGRHMNELGFTAVMDANVGMAGGIREIAAYRTALAEGTAAGAHLDLPGRQSGGQSPSTPGSMGIRPNDG